MAREMTEVLAVRLNPKEMGMVRRLAKKSGMTVSTYGRYAVMTEMLMEMDAEATAYVVKNSVGVIRRKLMDQFMEWGGFPELEKG